MRVNPIRSAFSELHPRSAVVLRNRSLLPDSAERRFVLVLVVESGHAE
jgi:hypothetical protein